MDAAELAQSGAAALVAAMTADVWRNTAARLNALFARPGGGPTEHEAILLEGCHEALIQTPTDAARANVTAIVRSLLRERLADDEEFAERLCAIVGEQSDLAGVHQTATVGRDGHTYQAGRDLTIGGPMA